MQKRNRYPSKRDRVLDDFWESQPKWQDLRDEAVAEAVQAKVDAKRIEAKTPNQQVYLDALKTKSLVLVQGVAGSGKTYMAAGYAVQLYREGKIKKIILCRPISECGRKMGAFPGTPREKFEPYMRPLLDSLENFMDKEEVERLIAAGTIELLPLELMRGCSIENAFVILDEAQNTEKEQVLMFLTRIGANSKFVMCGDPAQNDLRLMSRDYPAPNQTGFAYACRNLIGKSDDIAVAVLTEDDILRSALVKTILVAWNRGQ